MPLAPGERIDRYEVLGLLGSGGMGEVYRARDPKLQREVALKILRNGGDGTDGAARLLREARAAAALAHPNVLAIYDVGEVHEPEPLRGTSYIAMELVPGRSLRSFVGDESVPMATRVGWLADVAKALAAAHRAGLVHRDVKPENVMIRDEDCAVKVLDFGIARRSFGTASASTTEGQAIPTLTGQGVVMGTPFYMAPEQLRGDPLDGACDQFAWGVLAYELVCGAPPWNRDGDALSLVSEILSRDPMPPAARAPDVPRAVSDAIMRALEKSASRRFASMTLLLEAIGTTASAPAPGAPTGGVPLHARPTEPAPARPALPAAAPVSAAPAKPRRARTFALVGAAAAALVVVLGATLARRSAAPSTTGTAPPPSAIAGGCTSSAACVRAHGGEAWRCHSERHECVAVASPQCRALASAEDLARDDVVWFGGLFPLGPSDELPESRAFDLARQDFEQALGPLAMRGDDAHARPIAVALCDEELDPTTAARHLVDDVEAPVVVGFRRSKPALDVIANVVLPRRTLAIATIAQTASITKIPQPLDEPRLVWRTTLNFAESARPLGALIANVLEPRARAAGLVPGTALRVALVRTSAPGARDFTDVLFRSLTFNGKSALENGDDFRQFVLDEEHDGGADLVEPLARFAPHVIIYQGGTFVRRVAGPLEARWRRDAPRPFYLVGSTIDSGAWELAGTDAALRHRFFGVTNVATTMTNGELVLHYNLAFPNEPVTRTGAPQPSYDAFYLLAYATLALGRTPVTGPALSRAFSRLAGPGPRIEVGPTRIYQAFDALRGGGAIDLQGALGPLHLDPATGEAPIDMAILCLGVDDRGHASDGVESGLVYDGSTGKLVGAMKCP
jgi:serine/threonine-protein kinase